MNKYAVKICHYISEKLRSNNIDYMVHGNAHESFLKTWYLEPMEEHRLVLLDETKDYHSQDIKRRIQNV